MRVDLGLDQLQLRFDQQAFLGFVAVAQQLFAQQFGAADKLSFDDCSIKHYDQYALDEESFEAVEKEVQDLYGKNVFR